MEERERETIPRETGLAPALGFASRSPRRGLTA